MEALRKAFDSYLAILDDGDDPFEFNESKHMRKGQAPKVASLLEAHKLLKTLAPYFVHGVPQKSLLEQVLQHLDDTSGLNKTQFNQTLWLAFVVGRIRLLMNSLRICHQQEAKMNALLNQDGWKSTPVGKGERATGLGKSKWHCCCGC
jgi:hypothetical protein